MLLLNVLGPEADPRISLPAALDQVMEGIDGLIAESEKGGRTYLKQFKTKKKPHHMPIALPTQEVSTAPISKWKKRPAQDLSKRPTIFLFATR